MSMYRSDLGVLLGLWTSELEARFFMLPDVIASLALLLLVCED
jgi:hypothetical protein